MNTIDVAWAAGLFEGEGCISNNGRVSVDLTLKMTDKDVVDRFHEIVGVGYRTEVPPKKNWKRQYGWKTGAKADVLTVLDLLEPYFGQRRKEASLAARERLEENPGMFWERPKHCKNGHLKEGDNLYVHVDSKGVERRACKKCRSKSNAHRRKGGV